MRPTFANATLLAIMLCSVCASPRSVQGQPASGGALQILVPQDPESTTSLPVIHIAARLAAAGETTVTIGGTPVPLYETGIFARDSVPLAEGPNEIVIEAQNTGSALVRQVLSVTRVPEAAPMPQAPSLPLFIDSKSIEPVDNIALAPGEDLQVSFRGSPGNRAEFRVGGTEWLPMHEHVDAGSSAAGGLYRATLTLPEPQVRSLTDETSAPVLFRLSPHDVSTTSSAAPASTALLAESKGHVAVWSRSGAPTVVRVKDDQVGQLSFGLTEVRLGGPFLAELTSGTILRVIGRRGYNLKVELAPNQHAWVPAYQVEPTPAGTPVPHLQFTDIQVTTTLEGHDMVVIPYTEPAPFAVRDVPGNGRGAHPRLEVDLYGAHVAATWLSHRGRGELVRLVTVDQPQSGQVRVTIDLATPQLWGYRTEVTTGALRLIVRKPPTIVPGAASPLQGLTVALEAGHGGDNAGASGMSGSREKDIALAVALATEKQLVAAGAKVVQTRVGDESIGLSRRAARAMEANADMFISIHCNSAGRTRGILAVRGNSTLYKHPFNHELATSINRHILEKTGLDQFGVIGNFNYAPTRVLTWMPAVLVEQAFISNPMEEALMVNADFQLIMAESIREGIESYLRATNP